jgi:hypothetical protein
MKPIAPHSGSLQNLVFRSRDNQHLPEHGVPLDVADLFQKIGAHTTGGLTEEFGDVEDAEAGRWAEPSRQLRAGYIERSGLGNAQRLEIQNGGRGISQSSPRAGTSFRSSRNDCYSPKRSSGPRSRSGCM